MIAHSRSALEVRRATAILLVNQGYDPAQVSGYSRRQVFDIRARYIAQGLLAIEDKRKNNFQELLTKKQRQEIIETLKNKAPKELDPYYANYDYWTTGVLGDWIKKAYKVAYKSKTSYYLVFRQAKFTYHKPGRVYEKHDDEAVREWRKEMKPRICQARKDPKTVILCEDEMHLSSQTTVQKIWLSQGDYPKIEVSNKKESRSIYGFLNIRTGDEHAFKTSWQNMFITVGVLKKLRKIYPAQKLLLLWDGAGWHRGSEVQKFIKQDKRIETIHFPRYSPEENPQEHVWKNGRSQVTHNHFIKDIDQTTNRFVRYLNTTKFTYSLLGVSAD